MNILLIANKPPYPSKDGGTIATLNMAKALAENNQVTVIALSTKKHKGNIDQIPNELAEKIQFIYLELDTTIRYFQIALNFMLGKTPINVDRFFSEDIAQKICKHIKQGKYDVIQLEGLYLYNYIDTIRKVYSNKLILRAHNIEHQIWARGSQSTTNFLKKWYFNNLSSRLKKLELDIVNKVDAIVSISKGDDEWFRNNGFTKPSIIVPVSFYIENYQNTNSEKIANAISYIGALDWIPNQEGLLWFIANVWPVLLQKKPRITLHIAGRNASKWLINVFKSNPNIQFFGEIEKSTDFIQKYDIAIVPLLSGSGMRVKVIELMLNQVSIVSTSKGVDGISDNIADYAFIADDPKQFAEHVIQLLNNPQSAASVKSNAYSFVINHFDASKHTTKLTDFYNKLSNDI